MRGRRVRVHRDRGVTAPHHQRVLGVVLVDAGRQRARVGQLGVSAAQRDQRPVPLEHRSMIGVGGLRPIEASRVERRGVDRIRDCRRVPAEAGEFLATAMAHGVVEVIAAWAGEVRERRRRRPLLAHEQQGHERREQHECRRHFGEAGVEEVSEAFASCTVADLVVVLGAHDEPAARERLLRPGHRLGEIGDAAVVGVVAGSFTGEPRVQ